MWIFQIIIILLDLILVVIILGGWNDFLPSMRRILIGFVMVMAWLSFPLSTYSTMNKMKRVDFCLNCHEMTPYGDSLKVDDEEPLSAVHWQNNYIRKEEACYSCHTDYTMFGGVKAKMNGLKHLWVHYFEKDVKKIKLYGEYSPHNCLYCHAPGKKFRKHKAHRKNGSLPNILSGKKSCMIAGCHDMGHLMAEDMEDDDDDDEKDEDGEE